MTLAAVLACVLPVLIITGFGMYFILYAGVILMSAAAVYESVAESSLRKGVVVDISIKGLTRYYGSKPALDGIDLILRRMFGL